MLKNAIVYICGLFIFHALFLLMALGAYATQSIENRTLSDIVEDLIAIVAISLPILMWILSFPIRPYYEKKFHIVLIFALSVSGPITAFLLSVNAAGSAAQTWRIKNAMQNQHPVSVRQAPDFSEQSEMIFYDGIIRFDLEAEARVKPARSGAQYTSNPATSYTVVPIVPPDWTPEEPVPLFAVKDIGLMNAKARADLNDRHRFSRNINSLSYYTPDNHNVALWTAAYRSIRRYNLRMASDAPIVAFEASFEENYEKRKGKAIFWLLVANIIWLLGCSADGFLTRRSKRD